MVKRRGQISVPNVFSGLDDARSDYDAAKFNRFKRQRLGVTRVGRSADWHTRIIGDLLLTTEMARDVYRNSPVVGQCMNRASENKIQGGFRPAPNTGDPEIDADLKERWEEWSTDAEECDQAGEFTFAEMEEMADRNSSVDGDMFFLPLRSGKLEAVESHRCRTPIDEIKDFQVVNGVVLDGNRKRVQYWFTENDVNPFVSVTLNADIKRYNTRDAAGFRQVFHVYDPKRFSQTRGVTALMPIFDVLSMGEDAMFAKQVQQVVACSFAILRSRKNPFAPGTGQPTPPTGSVSTQQLADGTAQTLQEIYPGMEIVGQPGEEITAFSPNMGNTDFSTHLRWVWQFVGLNLGLPLVMMMMDGAETNFSGWRGAVDEARRHFRRCQKWLIRKLHVPTWLWKVRQWIAKDAVLRGQVARDGIKIFRHRWGTPDWPYIEPNKDAQSDLLQFRNGMISPRRFHSDHDRDHREIINETCEDNGYAIRRAIQEAEAIEKEFGGRHKVPWERVLALPMADGMTMVMKPEAEVAADQAAAENKVPARTSKA